MQNGGDRTPNLSNLGPARPVTDGFVSFSALFYDRTASYSRLLDLGPARPYGSRLELARRGLASSGSFRAIARTRPGLSQGRAATPATRASLPGARL